MALFLESDCSPKTSKASTVDDDFHIANCDVYSTAKLWMY